MIAVYAHTAETFLGTMRVFTFTPEPTNCGWDGITDYKTKKISAQVAPGWKLNKNGHVLIPTNGIEDAENNPGRCYSYGVMGAVAAGYLSLVDYEDQSDELTATEAAKIAGIYRQSLIARIKSGSLPGHLRHGRWMVRRSDLDAWTPNKTGPKED